jgi:hypothetical protein
MKQNTAIDRFALRRDKDMTPGARLDWLATARAFAFAPKKQVVQKVKKSKK